MGDFLQNSSGYEEWIAFRVYAIVQDATVTARGKSSRGMGRMRPENTGGEKADIDFQQAAKKANYQKQHKFISNYNTTSALLIFQQYRHTGIPMRSCVFE